MAHKDWCGKKCGHHKECEDCVLDGSIPCNPGCEHLGENGEQKDEECKTCDACSQFNQLVDEIEERTS